MLFAHTSTANQFKPTTGAGGKLHGGFVFVCVMVNVVERVCMKMFRQLENII